MKPLEGLLVLDFSQFLAGPSAALRLADLGARVIKVERPKTGDSSRKMTLKNLVLDGDSILFQTINRNKESFCADLKSSDDLAMVKALIQKADVMIENFRPGVMEKIGLHYEAVKKLNPRIVYGTVTGYGSTGPLVKKPGQDLLLQSMSGLAWLNGNADQPPTPFGLSVADSYTGVHLAQGIMACLFRRFKTGLGGLVEVNLLESILDMQFEVLTTYLNDGNKPPQRSQINNAHAYLSAPYGIYETADGYIALAMGSVSDLGNYLGSREIASYTDSNQWFTKRDEIKSLIATCLTAQPTSYWLTLLQSHGYWCSDVYTWESLTASDGFRSLDFVQNVRRPNTKDLLTTRCPITINHDKLKSSKWAPSLGEDTQAIINEFALRG